MSKADLAGYIERANQEAVALDHERLALQRQIGEARTRLGDIEIRLAYLQGVKDALAELMQTEETKRAEETEASPQP